MHSNASAYEFFSIHILNEALEKEWNQQMRQEWAKIILFSSSLSLLISVIYSSSPFPNISSILGKLSVNVGCLFPFNQQRQRHPAISNGSAIILRIANLSLISNDSDKKVERYNIMHPEIDFSCFWLRDRAASNDQNPCPVHLRWIWFALYSSCYATSKLSFSILVFSWYVMPNLW